MILDWGGLQAKIQVIIVIKDGLKYALSEIVDSMGDCVRLLYRAIVIIKVHVLLKITLKSIT